MGHGRLVLTTGVVQVITRGADVAFVIDEEATFDVVAEELRGFLSKQDGLWSKGDITLNVGQRMLARDELAQIKTMIETHSGLTVTRFWCAPESLDGGEFKLETRSETESNSSRIPKTLVHNEIAVAKPVRRTTVKPQAPVEPRTPAESQSSVESIIEDLKTRHNKNGARNRNRTEALFIKSTFRSGESVHHPGDVVVLADVNPGAEIRADGDIVVLGSLKGWAHAGASGDTKAVIIALDLPSARIKIGKYEGAAPTSPRRKAKSPAAGAQIAYVRSRSIQVATFAGRFARYSKGVPYDG
ncbi:MAG: septum site-determining protein MinC [SAR202 cluster bacterium Io17-Chloro-G6]|nr:MAG: septum site-determining protein MinC [SAR202 cluster bacterium Io17-Chloro-G6]